MYQINQMYFSLNLDVTQRFGQCGSLTIKIKSQNFSKNIYSISLIFKSKILIFKSEPKS